MPSVRLMIAAASSSLILFGVCALTALIRASSELQAATSLFWLQYIDLKDRLQPEPRHKLIFAYLLGIAACGIALLAFWLTERFGFPEYDAGDAGWLATYCFLIIGPIEEGAKVIVFLAVVWWQRPSQLVEVPARVRSSVMFKMIGLGMRAATVLAPLAGSDQVAADATDFAGGGRATEGGLQQ